MLMYWSLLLVLIRRKACSGPTCRRPRTKGDAKFGLLIVSSVLGIFTSACLMMKARHTPLNLDAYKGDGTISEIHFRPNPGIKVEFAPFSLNQGLHTVYRINGLPRRPIAYRVELVVPGVEDYEYTHEGIKIGLEGVLDFQSRDESGRVIFSCRGSPEQLGWGLSGTEAFRHPCARDQPRAHQALIMPEDFEGPKDGPRELEVSWEPGHSSQARTGYIRLRSGGTR